MQTHTQEILTCCVPAFSSFLSEALGETSQPQSHLPPLSHRLIHCITSSLKPLFPWQPGATLSLDPRCRLQERKTDENLPKASVSQSTGAQPEEVTTPQVHRLHPNTLNIIFHDPTRKSWILPVAPDMSTYGRFLFIYFLNLFLPVFDPVSWKLKHSSQRRQIANSI